MTTSTAPHIRRILIPIDVFDVCREAVDFAVDLAQRMQPAPLAIGVNFISPFSAETLTMLPLTISPLSRLTASGFCTKVWIARLSGRAPISGVKPFSSRNSSAEASHSTAHSRSLKPRRSSAARTASPSAHCCVRTWSKPRAWVSSITSRVRASASVGMVVWYMWAPAS